MIYDARGIRRRVSCPCPKCREQLTKVLRSGAEDGGITVRQRTCPACGHKWYTVQEPEYIVPKDKITWGRSNLPMLRENDSVADTYR